MKTTQSIEEYSHASEIRVFAQRDAHVLRRVGLRRRFDEADLVTRGSV